MDYYWSLWWQLQKRLLPIYLFGHKKIFASYSFVVSAIHQLTSFSIVSAQNITRQKTHSRKGLSIVGHVE